MEVLMGFKEFINEEIGLGDIDAKMSRLFNRRSIQNSMGSISNTDFSYDTPQGYIGDPDFTPRLPATTLNIPNVETTAKIETLHLKKNPIYIRLTDGTEAYFTYDQYKRIKGEPAVGKTMTIIFRRNPNDSSSNNSNIEKAIVRD